MRDTLWFFSPSHPHSSGLLWLFQPGEEFWGKQGQLKKQTGLGAEGCASVIFTSMLSSSRACMATRPPHCLKGEQEEQPPKENKFFPWLLFEGRCWAKAEVLWMWLLLNARGSLRPLKCQSLPCLTLEFPWTVIILATIYGVLSDPLPHAGSPHLCARVYAGQESALKIALSIVRGCCNLFTVRETKVHKWADFLLHAFQHPATYVLLSWRVFHVFIHQCPLPTISSFLPQIHHKTRNPCGAKQCWPSHWSIDSID